MATLPRVPTNNNQQYTLDSQIAAGASSLTLNQSVAGIIRAPGYVVIDRIDTSGNKTATKREYKTFTGVSGANLTGLSNVDGTDQVHAVGAIVEVVPDVKYEQDWYDVMVTEHDTSGVHASLPSLNMVNTQKLAVLSAASLQTVTVQDLYLSRLSLVSLHDIHVVNSINASGASLAGISYVRPAWYLPGVLSGASAHLGAPVAMPQSGNLQHIYATARIAASQASLSFAINKNFSSVINSSDILTIPINGTFASTASITTVGFNAGDVFTVGTANVSSFAGDVTVVLVAR